jgi:hypothetical protein
MTLNNCEALAMENMVRLEQNQDVGDVEGENFHFGRAAG